MNKLIVLPGDKGGWRVGDVEFVQGFTQGPRPRRLHIQKNQSTIDPASPFWEKTCASFEALYPRLRTDGLFVIEDWAGQYFLADEIAHALEAPGSHRYVELKAQYDEAIRTAAKPRPPLAQLGLQ